MSVALRVAFLFLVAWTGIEVLFAALRFRLRQELYRVRDRLYDRAVDKELDLERASVKALVRYVHLLVFAMPHLWLVLLAAACLWRRPRDYRIIWLEDESITDEAREAARLTLRAVALAGPVSFLMFLVACLVRWCCGRFKALARRLHPHRDRLLKALVSEVESERTEAFARSSSGSQRLKPAH